MRVSCQMLSIVALLVANSQCAPLQISSSPVNTNLVGPTTGDIAADLARVHTQMGTTKTTLTHVGEVTKDVTTKNTLTHVGEDTSHVTTNLEDTTHEVIDNLPFTLHNQRLTDALHLDKRGLPSFGSFQNLAQSMPGASSFSQFGSMIPTYASSLSKNPFAGGMPNFGSMLPGMGSGAFPGMGASPFSMKRDLTSPLDVIQILPGTITNDPVADVPITHSTLSSVDTVLSGTHVDGLPLAD